MHHLRHSPTRGPRTKPVLFALASLFILSAPLAAQPPPPVSGLAAPRLFVVTPCGGKIGTSFEMTFAGGDLEEPEQLRFSHPSITATAIVPPAPAPDPKNPKAPPPPRPPVTKFKVTIAGNAPPGVHDVRLVNKWGISNPRAFAVGDLGEVQEKDPNDDVAQAQRIELNQTVNGFVAAGTDVDYYVFRGQRGQRVVISCLTSSIDSRLTPYVEVYDAAGRLLGSSRHYYQADALLDVTLQSDGDYYVRVCDFTHTQGSAEHFYRLSISLAPWIDAVFPAVIEPGKPATITVLGRNLPGGVPDPTVMEDGRVLEKMSLVVQPPSAPADLVSLNHLGKINPNSAMLDGFDVRVRNSAGVSNPALITYARAPVLLDNDANDAPAKAQEIRLPCELFGRIERKGDRDWYAFSAKQNQAFQFEFFSDRLGTAIDLYALIRRADNNQDLAELDDNPDTITPVRFFTRSEDPPNYRFVAPADGKYYLLVGSRSADVSSGQRQFYNVRIAPDAPDYRVIVLPPDPRRPDGCCLRAAGQEHYTILVWRLGFDGPVTVAAERLPPGVTCQPQVVGPGLRLTALVLAATPEAKPWTGEIKIRGTAVIGGKQVTREARAASITWPVPQPQGVPSIARLDRSLVLAVRDKAPFHLAASAEKAVLLQGTKLNINLKLSRLHPDFKVPLQVGPIDPHNHVPGNLVFNNNNQQPITMNPGKDTAVIVLEAKADQPPGTYYLVLRGIAQMPYNKNPADKNKPAVPVFFPATPLNITVLPKQVANLAIPNANPTVKAGAQTELIVKVARMHEYAGEFKVKLVLPPNTKDLSAAEATIPPGKDEVKLVLAAAAGAAPGNRANLPVQVTAILQGNTPVMHEAKISVNVVK